MKLCGRKTDVMFRRYAIVDDRDLRVRRGEARGGRWHIPLRYRGILTEQEWLDLRSRERRYKCTTCGRVLGRESETPWELELR